MTADKTFHCIHCSERFSVDFETLETIIEGFNDPQCCPFCEAEFNKQDAYVEMLDELPY